MLTLSGDNADPKNSINPYCQHYKKNEITRDGYLSQTYDQPWQNQLIDIDYWIKASLTYLLSSSDFALYLDNYLNHK